MKTPLFIIFSFLFFIFGFHAVVAEMSHIKGNEDQLVTSLTQISFSKYPNAHNPSLIDTPEGVLLTFRWIPDLLLNPNVSHIGVVLLNELLEPISKPQLLNTRVGNKSIPSQSEDARVFSCQGSLYVIYNDNDSLTNPTVLQRRDMFIARLSYVNNRFVLSEPVKLYHQEKYFTVKWQKNWIPFEWHDALLIGYSIIPHEVLYADLISGECISFVITPFAHPTWQWKWGLLRGGTPAMLVDGEYLAFFHSTIVTSSDASNGVPMFHYYMGAYTFSNDPPFEVTHLTPFPIIAKGFYTELTTSSASPWEPKKVIFPGGYVVRDKHLYLAYGKDDQEMWIATIDREKLKKALVPVSLLE